MAKQSLLHIVILFLLSISIGKAQVCENGVLSVSASNATSTGTFVLEYVLVCDGSVYGPNTSGIFDFDALGISVSSSCMVYAVNHDGTETFANWPVSTGTCYDFIQQQVVVLPITHNQSVSICSGSSFTINGTDYYSTTGVYTETLSGVNCDSIVVLNLSVVDCPPIAACENEVINVSVSGANTTAPYELDYVLYCGGSVLATNSTGIFDLNTLGVQPTDGCTVYAVNHDGNEDYSTWPIPIDDCVTSVNLNMIVNPNDATTVNATSCNPADIGTSTDILTNQNGCDSVVTTITTSSPNAPLYGLYVADASNYYKINPLNGAIISTVSAQANSLGWMNGAFAVQQSNANLFWISDQMELNELNISSGVQTSRNTSISSLSYFWGLRYFDGFLYTISTSNDLDKTLVRVNPATGLLDGSFAPIEINGTASENILIHSSSVINPVTGMFYLPLQGNKMLAFNISSGTGNVINLNGYVSVTAEIGLLEINQNTGEMYALSGFSDIVNIAITGATTANVSLVKSLTTGSGFANYISAFDSDNDLYIFQAESGCSSQYPLIAVDVTTGQEWCTNPPGSAFYQMEFISCTPSSVLREGIKYEVQSTK